MGMTTVEFDRQKADKSKRFYIDHDIENDCYVIIDRPTGQVVGVDGGAPEDQVLVRDWQWVVHLLNRISEGG